MNDDDRKSILNRLYFKQLPARIVGNAESIRGITKILEDTVTFRRGDCCLFLGPRNSGKTLVIDKCIRDITAKYPGQLLVVQLNGLLHTDDKMAFREIARQLDEATGVEQSTVDTIEKLSLNGTIRALIQLFQKAELDSAAKQVSVLFVLEDVDRFMAANKQSLLYNLLDFSKNSSIGVSLVCSSSKLNVLEGLEKRVRSRFGPLVFSSRRTETLADFVDLVMAHVETANPAWNASIHTALEGPLRPFVEQVFYTSKDIRHFASIFAPVVQQDYTRILDGSLPAIEPNPLNVPSTTETRLQGLCELDMALLICAARSQARYGIEEVNFVMVDSEYRSMATTLHHERSQGLANTGYRIWSPKAAHLSWERLIDLELLGLPPAAHSTHQDLQAYRVDTSLDELRMLVAKDHSLYSWTRL